MMKKNAVQLGMIFGTIMAFSLIAINSIAASEINLKIIVSSIFGAAIGGLIFGLLMKYFFNKGDEIQIELRENEIVIKEGLGNHFRNMESVGGKLFLTNKRLVFKPHKLNIQKHLFELDLVNLATCQEYKTLGLFANKIRVSRADKLTEKFVVDKPNEWIEKINETKDTLQ